MNTTRDALTALSGVIPHPDATGGSNVVPRGSGGNSCVMCLDLPHRMFTHCPHCHASWTRTTRTAHCATCHRTFSSPSGFDRHLLSGPAGGCTDPAGVTTRKTGEPAFASDQRTNSAGTPVWRLAGERPEFPEQPTLDGVA